MTRPSSTTRTAGSVTLEPTSPASVSTVRTSSTAAFSCLPPQRTIAYTRELSLCLVRALLWGAGPHRVNADPHTGYQRYGGLACLSTRLAWGSPTPYPSCGQDYQTMRGGQPAAGYAGGTSTTGSPADGVLPASPSRAPASTGPGSTAASSPAWGAGGAGAWTLNSWASDAEPSGGAAAGGWPTGSGGPCSRVAARRRRRP